MHRSKAIIAITHMLQLLSPYTLVWQMVGAGVYTEGEAATMVTTLTEAAEVAANGIPGRIVVEVGVGGE